MKKQVIIKKVMHKNTFSMVFTFLGDSANEKFNINKPQHRESTLAWLSDHRIKNLVNATDDVNLLTNDLILEFRLVFINTIAKIKKNGTREQLQEMTSFIEDFITVSVLTYNIAN